MKVSIHESKVELKPENDTALITGDGRTFPEDMRKFLEMNIPHDTYCIGRSINQYPNRVMGWVNVDSTESKHWAEHLPLKNNGKIPIRHTMGSHEGFDVDWDILDEPLWNRKDDIRWRGSSALFAVLICLSLGYKKIYLAGCPMDKKGHWYWPETYEGPEWLDEDYQAWDEFAKQDEAKKVVSLSGYTKEVLSA